MYTQGYGLLETIVPVVPQKKLEIGRYHIKIPESVSPAAITQIKNLLLNSGIITTENQHEITAKIDSLDLDWATARGTFPKRLSRMLKHTIGKIPNDIISKCGQIAKSSCQSFGDTTILIVSDKVYWNAGFYGDNGSCFFGCRKAAPEVIFLNSGFSLALHTEEDEPLGRAWCIPYDNYYIIFNSYSKNGITIECTTFARLIMDLLGFNYYRKIELTNYGSDDGVLWINSKYGFIVGNNCWSIESVDLNIEFICDSCGEDFTSDDFGDCIDGEIYCSECSCKCDNCGDILNPDYANYHGDYCYCEDCFNELFAYCEKCEEYHYVEDMRVVENYLCCDHCYDSLFYECKNCGKPVAKDESCEYDGDDYCENCFFDLFHYCVECDEAVPIDDIFEYNGECYCEDCYTDKIVHCDECGDKIERTDAKFHLNKTYCEDCFNSLFVECEECGKTILESKSYDYDDSVYCESCYYDIRIKCA